MSHRFFTAKTLLWGLALLPFVAVAQVQRQMQSVPRRDTRPVEVAVFSINDFHGAFIASPEKGIAGAAAVRGTPSATTSLTMDKTHWRQSGLARRCDQRIGT